MIHDFRKFSPFTPNPMFDRIKIIRVRLDWRKLAVISSQDEIELSHLSWIGRLLF